MLNTNTTLHIFIYETFEIESLNIFAVKVKNIKMKSIDISFVLRKIFFIVGLFARPPTFLVKKVIIQDNRFISF